MHSIGFDIGKSTMSVHVPLNVLDLEIENTSKAINYTATICQDRFLRTYLPTSTISAYINPPCIVLSLSVIIKIIIQANAYS